MEAGLRYAINILHLSGRDLDDAILGVYGLKKVEDKEPKLKPKICPRCNASNAFEARFCMKCGLALDVKAAQEIEEVRAKTDSLMNLLMKDPEFREFLVKKLKDLTL